MLVNNAAHFFEFGTTFYAHAEPVGFRESTGILCRTLDAVFYRSNTSVIDKLFTAGNLHRRYEFRGHGDAS